MKKRGEGRRYKDWIGGFEVAIRKREGRVTKRGGYKSGRKESLKRRRRGGEGVGRSGEGKRRKGRRNKGHEIEGRRKGREG